MHRFPASGAIDPVSFPHLLADLHRQGATGSIKVEGPTYRKALHFRNGRILFGSSDDPGDQLGAILVAAGKISAETVEAESAKVGPGKPLAAVLSERGLVGQDDLSEAGRIKVERILADLLTRSSGSFEFEDGILPKGIVDLQASTPRAFMAATCAAGPELARVVLGSGEPALRKRDEGAALLAELEPDAVALARALDGKSSLNEASRRAGLTAGESEGLAAGLVLLGLVEPARAAVSEPEGATFAAPVHHDAPPIASPPAADPERKRTIFPPEPLVVDRGKEEPPVVKTAAGAATVDLREGREAVQRRAGELDQRDLDLDLHAPAADRAPAAPTMPAALDETAPHPRHARASETAAPFRRPVSPTDETAPHSRHPRTPEVTEPLRRPASPPLPATPRSRSPVPALLVVAGLVGVAGVGLWLWLNTSGREPIQAGPEATAIGSPTPAAVVDEPAAAPPDHALELLRRGELAGAARGFAGSLPREGYTIQLLVACSPQTAIKAAAQVTSSELYVLPIRMQGRDCYRVLYGRYGSEAAAATALRHSVPDYFKRDRSQPRIEPLSALPP